MRFRSDPEKIAFVTLPASYSVRTVVLLHESLMASWSAVQVPSTPKTQAPVLPEPGLLHVRALRASHSSRHRIELTSWCNVLGRVGKTTPTDLDGEMDTKPKDAKPADLDLELAVFAAP